MSTMESIAAGARTFLRDYPLFFEVDTGPLNTLTVRLPHPLVTGTSLGVYATDTSVAPAVTTQTDKWALDERNGLLKITDATLLNKRMVISGYHFSWFLDSDLAFHANQIYGEMSYYEPLPLATMQAAEEEIVQMGTIVNALWSLAMELSLDIDVSTPEGMFIPVRQRFTQVVQMLQYWENQYQTKASQMNMGLGALSQFRLRRVAYMTGRYVPVYKDREFDDPKPPKRLYPPIPEGAASRPPASVSLERLATVEEIGREGQDLGFGGWVPLGTHG
jgi:hypothetical protein